MYCEHLSRRDLDPKLTPIAPHPDGLAPNFESMGLKIVMRAAGYPCVLLSLAFLIMRLCAHSKLKNGTKRPLDDYLCIVAWIFTAGNAATILAQVGAYKHAYDMRVIDLKPSYYRRMAASCILYGPSMFFAKASIFALYLRIFGSVTWVRWTSWTAIVLSGIGYSTSIPTCGVAFFPYLSASFDQGWNVNLEKLTRESMVIPGLVMGTCNLATDLVALAIPIPVILGLRMNWKKKLGYCAIFLTGIIGMSASVFGLVARVNLIGPKRNDGTWWQSVVLLTSIIELSIAIIISCAPFAIAFWRKVLHESALFSGVRSRHRLRKSNDMRPPTTPPLSTIRTSRIGSAGSDFNMEVLPPRSRGPVFRNENRESASTDYSEHIMTDTPSASQAHLAHHAI